MVCKYVMRRRGAPSQMWPILCQTHAKELITLDFFTMSTATFKVLFVLIIVSHDRDGFCIST